MKNRTQTNILREGLNRTAAVVNGLLANQLLRKASLNLVQKFIHQKFVTSNLHTRAIREAQYRAIVNLLNAMDRGLKENLLCPSVRNRLLRNFLGKVVVRNPRVIQEFQATYQLPPPGFVVISPEKRCNLRCTGCYAASGAHTGEHLSFAVMNRLVTEKTATWDSYFTVISGGEPLLWEDDGKNILDLFAAQPDNYFLMFTNGTLITETVAKTLAKLGNVTPAISVEGFAEQTDQRRGKGVFNRVLQAMANLRAAGVPFGISVTATRHNAELVLSAEFVDFFFNQQKALYGWLFQYMPIGRGPDFSLLVTPEQRLWMLKRELELIEKQGIFYMDFWNGGIYASGCIAGARSGGYFYVEWNGNITPCVFIPYAIGNINEIYRRGGSVNEVLNHPLFKKIREFQFNYGYQQRGKVENWFAPCFIRDHYDLAGQTFRGCKVMPIDETAEQALNDPSYEATMIEYGRKFRTLSDEIWQKRFGK